MAQSDQSKQTDFTLRTDFQHDDDGVPPSGEVRPDAIKGIVITVIAAIIAYVLYAFLPFEPYRSNSCDRNSDFGATACLVYWYS